VWGQQHRPIELPEVEFMKVSLVVAQGVHAGKTIPITSPQFLIGRDPHCNLRPASPAISKQHCGVFIRDGKVFVQDYGSTNGTSINGEPVSGEREVSDNDMLKVGPLEFTLKIEDIASRPTEKATLPKATGETASARTGAETVVAPSVAAAAAAVDDAENAAAMFLAMDETGALDPTAEALIPEGTTVMEVPAVGGQTQAEKAKKEQGDTSKAAADLLSKYMRRPRA
jgi:pSer/pThr/pTyr-binding forkhead associated (FHA) protein